MKRGDLTLMETIYVFVRSSSTLFLRNLGRIRRRFAPLSSPDLLFFLSPDSYESPPVRGDTYWLLMYEHIDPPILLLGPEGVANPRFHFLGPEQVFSLLGNNDEQEAISNDRDDRCNQRWDVNVDQHVVSLKIQ